MKFINSSISSIFFGILLIGFVVFSGNDWLYKIPGRIFTFISLILIIGIQNYYINIYSSISKIQKLLIIFSLFLFSGIVLYYNIIVWGLFVFTFCLLYYFFNLKKSNDVMEDEMPLNYILRKKNSLKTLIYLLIVFSTAYWLILIFLPEGYIRSTF